MEVKNKKWLKYIGQSAVVLLLMGAVVGLYTTVQKDQKQNEAKTVQTTENTKLNIAVVNEDQAVKLNGKEYNLGCSQCFCSFFFCFGPITCRQISCSLVSSLF